MEKSTRNSKNQVLKILSSLLLLLLMLPGVLAQAPVSQEFFDLSDPGHNFQSFLKTDHENKIMPGFRLNVVNSDALIHGLIVGRGLGANYLNVALGYNAVYSNTSGAYNTGVGSWALSLNTGGTSNTALGSEALRDNTSGSRNIAVGGLALGFNTSGTDNTALGFLALRRNTTGGFNVGLGNNAHYHNVTGNENVAIGHYALYNAADRDNLVAVGAYALYNNGLNATLEIHATANTALGSKALNANTTGSWNTATGFETLYSNTTGFSNTATGFQALISNTTGHSNTATGFEALRHNTTGNYNTAYGRNALRDLTAGSENVAFGDYAGSIYTSISRGTFVGSEAKPNLSNLTNITGIGFNARPTASNQVRIGNTNVTSIGGQVTWTAFSDGGYKNNLEEDVAGLDFILKLRPVSYNLDAHRLASDLGEDQTRAEDGSKATAVPDEITQKSRDEKAAIRYTGFVAQEVEATVNELGVAFSGVDAPVNKSGYYGLRYADFVVPLVRAVQEQQAQIEALSPEGIDALQEELSELRAENVRMQGQIKDIISQLENLGVDLRQSTGYGINVSPQQYPSGNARLEQNTPNPFHENTVIRYSLPEGTQRAQILITDMAGTQVMALPLEHQGAGQVLIHGGSLTTGTYVYTLVVDGRMVESKRMVLL